MKGTKKTQRIMLAIAFPIILAGLVLVVCEEFAKTLLRIHREISSWI